MLPDILPSEETAFLAHCDKIRGLSKNTVDAYEQDIAAFMGFFQRVTLGRISRAKWLLTISTI